MTLALIREHRLAQISNGALAAALVMELAAEFKAGRLQRSEFIAALVGADLLSHQAAVRLAAAFVRDVRTAANAGGVLVEAEFDTGAAYGRAIGTLRDLDDARDAIGSIIDRDWDTEFWRIIEADAVRADRIAKGAGRDTVMASAEASGRGWRRVSDGKPCSFCAMLVSRGPAYTSRNAALTVVGRERRSTRHGVREGRGRSRGDRGLGAAFHDSCGCTAVEVIGEWTPTAEEQRYVDLYDQAVEKCQADGVPADAKNIQARMRELGQGVINDAHQPPETKVGGAGGGRKPPPSSGSATAGPPSWEERQLRPTSQPGRVSVPAGHVVDHHELRTARRLAQLGADVAFRALVNAEGVKNPDIVLDGETWEMKAPQGSSERSTIASQFKRGRRQSARLVIDLARCGLSDDLALAQIRRRFDGQDRIEQVLIIDHQGIVTHLRR